MVRVLVTGSRTWEDRKAVWAALDAVAEANAAGPMVVVHGACPRGADAHASMWCRRWGATEEPHPADWRRLGRGAGMQRNLAMVLAGADVCLAFMDLCMDTRCPRREVHSSHGVDHCVRMARRAGIPVLTAVSGDLVTELFADPPPLVEQVRVMLDGAEGRREGSR